MFIKGLLYVRFDWGELSELMYPLEAWDNTPGMPHMSIARAHYGFQPSFRVLTFEATPEGYKSQSGNFIKFEKATDQQLFEILNFWNDAPSIAGRVGEWVAKVRKNCSRVLLESEIVRLEVQGKKGRYWT